MDGSPYKDDMTARSPSECQGSPYFPEEGVYSPLSDVSANPRACPSPGTLTPLVDHQTHPTEFNCDLERWTWEDVWSLKDFPKELLTEQTETEKYQPAGHITQSPLKTEEPDLFEDRYGQNLTNVYSFTSLTPNEGFVPDDLLQNPTQDYLFKADPTPVQSNVLLSLTSNCQVQAQRRNVEYTPTHVQTSVPTQRATICTYRETSTARHQETSLMNAGSSIEGINDLTQIGNTDANSLNGMINMPSVPQTFGLGDNERADTLSVPWIKQEQSEYSPVSRPETPPTEPETLRELADDQDSGSATEQDPSRTRRRRSTLERLSTEDRKARRRLQNRKAAEKCRKRKKERAEEIVMAYRKELSSHKELKEEMDRLRAQVQALQSELLRHKRTCSLVINMAEPHVHKLDKS